MAGHTSPGRGPGSSSAGPLVPYVRPSPLPSEETTPLMPGKTRPTISRDKYKSLILGLLTLLVSLFFIVNLSLHFFNCPLYPWTMNAIRSEWNNEVAQHDLVRKEWLVEKQEHDSTVEGWKLQREWLEKDVAHRIKEEEERQERTRQEWNQESERHGHEVEEFKREVARMIRDEQEREERFQKEWAHEVEKHKDEWNEMLRRENEHRESERRKWQREVEDHDRITEERRKREEEERLKLNMFWGSVQAHRCTTYATREYTAQLMNLPTTWEHRVEACKATPLEVHGISHLPKTCEDRGPGVVIGRWEVNQREPACTTYWDSYDDKGCTSPGSRKRHITHKLMDLPEDNKWKEFCAATPISFGHLQFPGAQMCFTSVWGVYGQWEIDDSNC